MLLLPPSQVSLIRLRRLLKKSLEEMRCYHSTAQGKGLGYHPQNSSRPLAKRRNFGAELPERRLKIQVDRTEQGSMLCWPCLPHTIGPRDPCMREKLPLASYFPIHPMLVRKNKTRMNTDTFFPCPETPSHVARTRWQVWKSSRATKGALKERATPENGGVHEAAGERIPSLRRLLRTLRGSSE